MAPRTFRSSRADYKLLRAEETAMEGSDGKAGSARSPDPVHVIDDPNRPRHSGDFEDLEGLSLYDKKCVLINREIDAQGMGRYQWYSHPTTVRLGKVLSLNH